MTVSLDDFGTGKSSLAYLMRLPVDCVKIDEFFVQELTVEEAGRQARAMVEAMAALARALGMRTVAEGIETETHRSSGAMPRKNTSLVSRYRRRASNLTPRHGSNRRRLQFRRRRTQEADRVSGHAQSAVRFDQAAPGEPASACARLHGCERQRPMQRCSQNSGFQKEFRASVT